ncbi:MAG TPA: polysaccharide biosynthesis/export family protein [Caulobacteraceae bacterium]|nr:polysaccharide biosynthesis/export family protein [Caulobacteraceae bacterium]
MTSLRALSVAVAAVLLAAPGLAAARPPPLRDFPSIAFATWTDAEPPYRLYPGDQLSISFPDASELDAEVEVGPDGRIQLPLVGGVMAADRTVAQLRAEIDRAYAGQLRRPDAEVAVRQAAPLKIYVAGEVARPGVYDMEGDMDVLRAIMDAGGFTSGAKRGSVVLIRRGPGGREMLRTLDLRGALKDPAHADLAPLRRFDIVYVPKTGLAEVGDFLQRFAGAVPGSVVYSPGRSGVYAVAP